MHSKDIRQIHSIEIFYTILTTPGISQKQVIKVTGIDKSTVSLVVSSLNSNGIIEIGKAASTGMRGRPASELRISGDRGLLVGAHLELEKLTLVATSIGGHIFDSYETEMPQSPHLVGEGVARALDDLCSRLGKSIQDIDSLGVTVPGQIANGRYLIHSPNLHWDDVPILDRLQEQIDVPVVVGNDTHAAALSEHFFGCAVGLDNFVFLSAGLGVGGAIFLNGKLLRGEDGFAGEIGHTKVVTDGRLCHCGARGCLSAYITTQAMLASIVEMDPSIDSLDKLRVAIRHENPFAVELLEEVGSLAGLAIANVINTLNPPNIVVAGMLARHWNTIKASFVDSVRRNALQAPFETSKFIVCELGSSQAPKGGVALALERHVQAKGAI